MEIVAAEKSVSEMTEQELTACLKLITIGGAVCPEYAEKEFPLSLSLAVCYSEKTIVGVGAIKRIRKEYAEKISEKSGFYFNPESFFELGYLAVAPSFRHNGLSGKIVKKLSQFPENIFAVTGSPFMKKVNERNGFIWAGKEWSGVRAPLTLWINSIQKTFSFYNKINI